MTYPWKIQRKKLYLPKEHVILQKKKNAYAFYAQPIFRGIIYLASKENVYGMPWIDGTVDYCRGLAFWTHDKVQLKEITNKVTTFIINHPKHLFKLKEKFDNEARQFLQIVEKEVKDAKDAKGKKLYDFFARFHEHYERTYIFAEPIVWPIKDTIFAMLHEKYNTIPVHDFNILLTSPTLTFTQKERLSLLGVALSDKKEEGLQEHAKKFFWIPFDYGVTTFDDSYFRLDLEKLLKKPTPELQKEYEELHTFEKRIPEQQKGLLEKHSIPVDDQMLFKLLRTAAYLLDYKKEVFTKAHVAIAPVQERLAKIAGMENKFAQFIHADELYDLLVLGNVFSGEKKKEIAQRHDGCIYWINKDDPTIYFDQGREVEENLMQYLKEHDAVGTLSEIKGTIAYPGNIKGKARIINSAHHAFELQEGEILIAEMTSPDYMMAIKKASAIVTNEGGITCHAAIISRELKIPCIVGTKNATRVFETGDVIEITQEGVVRVLK